MNGSDFIREVSQSTGVEEQEVARLLSAILNTFFTCLLRDGKVSLRGFGSVEMFYTKPTRRLVPGKGMAILPRQPKLRLILSPYIKARLHEDASADLKL